MVPPTADTGTAAERKETMRQIIADVLEIEPSDITETSRFQEDHGADSLRAIEILAELEKVFKVEIPQAELVKMTDLASVYEIFKAHAGWSD